MVVLWPSLRSHVPPSSSITSPGGCCLPVLQRGLLMGQKLGSQKEGLTVSHPLWAPKSQGSPPAAFDSPHISPVQTGVWTQTP